MDATQCVVGVASSRPLVRAGITTLLRVRSDWAVVAGASGVDALVLDVDGACLLGGERLSPQRADVPCVVVTPPRGTVERSWIDGAGAVVALSCTGRELADAVASVLTVRQGRARPAAPIGPGPRLSRRELEMLTLISVGCSNDEIAAAAHLGINTVKTYLRTAYRKIGVTSRTQAVLWCLEHGLDVSTAHAMRARRDHLGQGGWSGLPPATGRSTTTPNGW